MAGNSPLRRTCRDSGSRGRAAPFWNADPRGPGRAPPPGGLRPRCRRMAVRWRGHSDPPLWSAGHPQAGVRCAERPVKTRVAQSHAEAKRRGRCRALRLSMARGFIMNRLSCSPPRRHHRLDSFLARCRAGIDVSPTHIRGLHVRSPRSGPVSAHAAVPSISRRSTDFGRRSRRDP